MNQKTLDTIKGTLIFALVLIPWILILFKFTKIWCLYVGPAIWLGTLLYEWHYEWDCKRRGVSVGKEHRVFGGLIPLIAGCFAGPIVWAIGLVYLVAKKKFFKK